MMQALSARSRCLGLDADENLFLGGGEWQARYVPAVRQRGPFMIGFQERDDDGEIVREPMIHVDLDHPRISRTEGQPLFRDHGGNSPYLDHLIRVLRVIHDGLAVTDAMFAAFEESGLIEPVMLQITLDDTTRYDLPDCFTISAQRLATLDGATLERLHRSGLPRACLHGGGGDGQCQPDYRAQESQAACGGGGRRGAGCGGSGDGRAGAADHRRRGARRRRRRGRGAACSRSPGGAERSGARLAAGRRRPGLSCSAPPII